MFTGIVAAVGTVRASARSRAGRRVAIDAGRLGLADVAQGDSIAVNGVCLTVVARKGRAFEADVSRETLECTAGFAVGDRVNLEKAMRASDRLGGHLVSGHVDGLAELATRADLTDMARLTLRVPKPLARFVAQKGSVALDGVSLTVNDVAEDQFSVLIIPHTLSVTTLGALKAGDALNLEVDVMARYAARLTETR